MKSRYGATAIYYLTDNLLVKLEFIFSRIAAKTPMERKSFIIWPQSELTWLFGRKCEATSTKI